MGYEDKESKRKESLVASYLSTLAGAEFHPNPNYAGTDYCYLNVKYERWFYVEIKTRNCKWGKYPDKMLEQGKYGHVVPHLHTGVGFQYAVATYDFIGIWTTLHASKANGYRRDFNGRVDRGDPNDMKLCIYIPNDEFKLVKMPPKLANEIWRER